MAPVNFSGTWKHSKDEGLDDFLKELGVGAIKRKAATSMSPQQDITQNGDEFVVTNKTSLKTETIKFTVGQDFQFTQALTGKEDTRKAVWDGNKLVNKSVSDPDAVVITRELVDPTHMTITQQKGSAVAVRHFTKA